MPLLRFVYPPCSFLAGLRVDRLIGVKWRAVVHDPTAPPNGQQVPGELADLVDCGSAWVIKALTRLAETAPVAGSGGAHES